MGEGRRLGKDTKGFLLEKTSYRTIEDQDVLGRPRGVGKQRTNGSPGQLRRAASEVELCKLRVTGNRDAIEAKIIFVGGTVTL